jgi:hypothetical protein
MLRAIDGLREDERGAFGLMRIQGMTRTEATQLLGVSAVTVKRRLSLGLRLLTEQLADLRPGEKPPDAISRCIPAGSGFSGCRSPGTQPPRGAGSWL